MVALVLAARLPITLNNAIVVTIITIGMNEAKIERVAMAVDMAVTRAVTPVSMASMSCGMYRPVIAVRVVRDPRNTTAHTTYGRWCCDLRRKELEGCRGCLAGGSSC